MAITPAPMRPPCGNRESSKKEDVCTKEGTSTCGNCHLVMYCSRACQKAHWSQHKRHCKSTYMDKAWAPEWQQQGREPNFKYTSKTTTPGLLYKYRFWDDQHAFDVLALKQHEGEDYGKDLSLLFPACIDLGKVIKTVCELPKSYNHTLSITLNNSGMIPVMRALTMLVLLLNVENTEAAIDCIVHLWYSALIDNKHIQMLLKYVNPLLFELCGHLRNEPREQLCSRTWVFGKTSLRITLTKDAWCEGFKYLIPAENVTQNTVWAKRCQAILADARTDIRNLETYGLSPTHRVCRDQYWGDGLLLPISAHGREFMSPNPTFYKVTDDWMASETADPTHGWHPDDVAKAPYRGPAKDVYGRLNHYVKGLLREFQQRLKSMTIQFDICGSTVDALVRILKPGIYDRIEANNLADDHLVGLRPTLKLLSPLLRPASVNPHATLLTNLVDAIEDAYIDSGDAENPRKFAAEVMVIRKFRKPPPPGKYDQHHPWYMFMREHKKWARDGERYLRRYLRKQKVEQIMQDLKLELKPQNTIVKKWPTHPDLSPSNPNAKKEFDAAVATHHNGLECWLEWKRDDVLKLPDYLVEDMNDLNVSKKQDEVRDFGVSIGSKTWFEMFPEDEAALRDPLKRLGKVLGPK